MLDKIDYNKILFFIEIKIDLEILRLRFICINLILRFVKVFFLKYFVLF